MLGVAFTATLGFRVDIWRYVVESVFNSENYIKIRDNIESTWPEYKIKAANELIISKHGVKIKSRRDEHDQKEIY